MTEESLAALLYDSLYKKLLPLPDNLIVYPAHGAGSACGKNMMQLTKDTLGNQKKVNYALNQSSKSAFIDAVLDGLQPAPAYFKANVALNKSGAQHFDRVLDNSLQRLSAVSFEALAEQTGALILDTRSSSLFAKGFIPHAINIGIEGGFAPWVGAMVGDIMQPILLVTEKGMAGEVVTRLGRIGFDQVLGVLEGGFETWIAAGKEVDKVHRISVDTFEKEFKQRADLNVLDVRKQGEYAAEHIKGAWSRPLSVINDWMKELDTSKHFYIHCAGGYRSMIAVAWISKFF
jgi:hydroxyacylglutathione hydrolase